MDFAPFDQRGYPTLAVRDGYGAWAATYEDVVQDEMDLRLLYAETGRLAAAGAAFVVVGYHPHFLMTGMPTHFNGADGQPVAVQSWVHLTSDHAKAAHGAGWSLAEMDEGVVDDAWIAK